MLNGAQQSVQDFDGKGDFKVWSNGTIDRIDYSIINSNTNNNFQQARNGLLYI